MGKGIYGSPFIDYSQSYSRKFTVDGETYLLAFQCRVRPDSVRISSVYIEEWVARESSLVRPYGLLITKVSVVNN